MGPAMEPSDKRVPIPLDYARPQPRLRLSLREHLVLGWRQGTFATAIMIFYLIGLVMMGADIIQFNLRPLKALGIGFPAILSYTSLIAPVIAASMWWPLRRRIPNLAAVIALLLGWLMILGVAWYADSRIEKIPTTRSLSQQERQAVETRLGFPIWAQGGRDGTEIFVPKDMDHIRRTREELGSLGVLRQ